MEYGLDLSEWGAGEAGMSGPPVRYEYVATTPGDWDPLGALAKVGQVFGTIGGAVAAWNQGSMQLQLQRDQAAAARDKAAFDRELGRLNLQTARESAGLNAELARVDIAARTGLASGQLDFQRAQLAGAIGLAQVKGATEVAKAQTELTRARALDQFYSQNPGYAITGIPNTIGGGTWLLVAVAGIGIWLATRKE